MNHDEAWRLLDPYLDGALDAERRWAVAAHIAGCPECSAYVADGAHLRATVRARLGDILAPTGLTERIRANVARVGLAGAPPASRPPRRLTPLLSVAAALALVLVGIWWIARTTGDRGVPELDLPGELAATHAVFAQDDSLLEMSGDPTAISSWFRNKVPFPVEVPEVPGYELRGARLVAIDGRPAALIVYEFEAARRYVSLLTFAAPAGDLAGLTRSGAFATGTQGEIAVAIWSEGDIRHALVAGLSQPDLLRLATAVAGPS